MNHNKQQVGISEKVLPKPPARHYALSSILFGAIILSGCSTISGSQAAVDGLTPINPLPISTALLNYHKAGDDARDGLSRRDYRDYILATYLSAIEANYKSFTDQLQSSDRGSALGLDLLVLGLSGGTALAKGGAVHDLATITATASGARATIDKRLFFDRTLPAVVASMDADRATIKADIARKRNLAIQQYSLDEAVDDLNRLQQAGRLDRAVARMTQVAQADRQVQQTRLDAIVAACDNITKKTAELNLEFRNLLISDPAEMQARLKAAAQELGIETAEGATLNFSDVAPSFDAKLCDDEKKQDFIEKLKLKLNSAAGMRHG